jgi:hypothetical protein
VSRIRRRIEYEEEEEGGGGGGDGCLSSRY